MIHVVPPSLLFDFRIPLQPCSGPSKKKTGDLLNLTQKHQLFVPSVLNENSQFATLFAGWNQDGLGLKVRVEGKPDSPVGHIEALNTCDHILLWLDTRPTGDVHRATEYCHHFAILPVDERAKNAPSIAQQLIAQQRATRIEFQASKMLQRTKLLKKGYETEVWMPASQLNGFQEISEIGRLGFSCTVNDAHLGSQPFHLCGDFPSGYDPSTWISLDLGQ